MTAKTPKEADFLTDAEIAVRWGVCDKTARRAMVALEKAGGFPRKDPLFGNKRYWPAVDAYMKRRAGLPVEGQSRRAPSARAGEDFERWPRGDGKVEVISSDGRSWIEDAKPTDPPSWHRKPRVRVPDHRRD